MGGIPIRTRGQTLWNSRYIQYVPCASKYLQGGSDISGTLSMLHRCFNIIFFITFFRKIVLAVYRNRYKNKKSHSGKDESTGRHRSRDSLQALRRTYHDRG